ncbi:peptide ABC transporter permease [Legionella beliardensis]|uniref:Peptide ABC transporter permease n=1 Tax=Legionella beliardensis TaxID=91822 RepID=A0A378HZL2_9GAMM|nr:ABC transporter permease [Legionella beliardensis]STX28378.1 peptide ABC transporter permease [Legionella beliardensis]
MIDLFWTDQWFLFLLSVGFIFLLVSLRKEPVRRSWRYLFYNPIAVSAGIILFFFLSIGILDSIHIRTVDAEDNGVVVSVLDKLIAPVGQMYEKTYSAPLALTLYSTETAIINGQAKQIYPRLKYVPSNIKTFEAKQQLIFYLLNKAFLQSLIVFGILVILGWLLHWLLFAKRKINFNASLNCGLITLFICLFFLLSSYWLSRNFHLFGTGKIGQDIFYYTIKSIRTGLIIGTLTTLFMLPFAVILGIAAGYFGGIIDDVIQYIYTTLSSIPGVLLITASVLSMQTYIANHPEQFATLEESADARLFALCLILGITSWTSLCRILRAEALKLREIDFVLAAKALGSSAWRILYKHLLPNVMPIVLINLVLDFSFLVLAEAVLSYVGVGVSPMTISWGNMINGARLELAREPIVWWPMMAAFLFMFILVLASNLFADAVREAFDPHRVQGKNV